MNDVALMPASVGLHPARRDCRLLICAVDDPGDTALGAVRRLSATCWTPERAAAVYCILPSDADSALGLLHGELRSSSAWGVLLVETCPQAREFRIEMRAQNRPAGTRSRIAAERISPLGPAVARATSPVADMRHALEREGLPVRTSSDAGANLGNDLLYRLLTDAGATSGGPAVGLLHLPDVEADEAARESDLDRGVMAAARAFADTLCLPVMASA